MEKEDYVSYEVAKLLKSKGFNKPCDSYFEDTEEGYICWACVHEPKKETTEKEYLQPTLYEAQKWMREQHQIAICSYPYSFHWDYTIFDLSKIMDNCHKILGSRVCWESYEEALNEGIKESLKLI